MALAMRSTKRARLNCGDGAAFIPKVLSMVSLPAWLLDELRRPVATPLLKYIPGHSLSGTLRAGSSNVHFLIVSAAACGLLIGFPRILFGNAASSSFSE